MDETKIALVGCGFVADYYMSTLNSYPELKVVGVFDKNNERAIQFSNYYGVTTYRSIETLLSNQEIEIVLNLTDPRSHYYVSKQCLLAGKHVYSEKPLAMKFDDALELVNIAKSSDLKIVSAPCSVLSNSVKNLEHALSLDMVGKPRLIYAELDDGMVHKMAYKKWVSQSGAPWPYRDEFEVGCTLEHAGYYLAWLVKLFGPVATVTAFSDCLIDDKVKEEDALSPADTPDVSIAILKFVGGSVARLSTTIIAPHNHALQIFGDNGVISVNECWDNEAPVYIQKRMQIRRKTFISPIKSKVRVTNQAKGKHVKFGNTNMDFLLGVHDLAKSIHTKTPSFFDADFSLHITELALAIQNSGQTGGSYTMCSQL